MGSRERDGSGTTQATGVPHFVPAQPITASTCVIASVGGSTTRFTLTLAGAFTSYTYESGDQVKLQNASVGAATYGVDSPMGGQPS